MMLPLKLGHKRQCSFLLLLDHSLVEKPIAMCLRTLKELNGKAHMGGIELSSKQIDRKLFAISHLE